MVETNRKTRWREASGADAPCPTSTIVAEGIRGSAEAAVLSGRYQNAINPTSRKAGVAGKQGILAMREIQ
jgi:hypothetical protein